MTTTTVWTGWESDRLFVENIWGDTTERAFAFDVAPTFGAWTVSQPEPSRVEERDVFLRGVRIGKELIWFGDGNWSTWLEIDPDTPGVTMWDA